MKLLTLFLALMLAAGANCQNDDNPFSDPGGYFIVTDPVIHIPTLAKYHLVGPVSEVVGEEKGDKEWTRQYAATFDTQGRLLSARGRQRTKPGGRDVGYETVFEHRYDSAGRLSENLDWDDGEVGRKTLFEYSGSGNLVGIHDSLNKGLPPWDTTMLGYDEKGRIVVCDERLASSGTETVSGEWTYEVDQQGRTVECAKLHFTQYFGDTAPQTREILRRVLGPHGPTEEFRSNWADDPESRRRTVIEYKAGVKSRTTEYDGTGIKLVLREFAADGQPTRIQEFPREEWGGLDTTFSYDKDGNLLVKIERLGTTKTYTEMWWYQYDARGNWVWRIQVYPVARRWPIAFSSPERRTIK